MLAFSVREALRQAAAAFGPPGVSIELASPATPEAVYWAIEQARGHRSGHGMAPGSVEPAQPADGAPRMRPESERVSERAAERASERVGSGA
jgi:xanthine dehydrogenase large subunit